MLKGIPKLISPELLKILCEMGHSDEITIVDANFPAANFAKRLIRLSGVRATEVLSEILKLVPLDSYVESPAALMDADDTIPEIWAEYTEIINKNEGKAVLIEKMERKAFYKRAQESYAIIATGEEKLYANIVIKKGVIE